MTDRFPEAFSRFEQDVDVEQFDDYRQLAYAFSHWAGKRWRDTYLQNRALKREGKKLGFEDAQLPAYFRKPVTAWRESSRYFHKGMNDRQISIINDGIRKGMSANRIQRQLRKERVGIRRKELLKHIREMKVKSPKPNPEKNIPKKYRR